MKRIKIVGRLQIITICLGLLSLLNSSSVEAQSGQARKTPAPALTPAEITPMRPGVEQFMRITGASLAGVSWDGETVYFTSQMSGTSQVYRVTNAGWPEQLTAFAHGSSFFALNYAGSAALIGADEGGTENTQLYLLDLKTSRLHQLTDNPKVKFENVVWAKNDSSFFFRSNEANGRDFFIYRYWLTDTLVQHVFGDSSFGGSFSTSGLSPDGLKLLVTRWPSNFEAELYLLDLATSKSSRLLAGLPPAKYESLNLMPDNRRLFLLTDNTPDGFLQLAKLDLQADRLETVPDRWLAADRDNESLIFSRDLSLMAALTNTSGFSQLSIREVESKQELPVPDLRGIYSSMAFDKNRNLIFTFQSGNQPANVWHWSTTTSKLKQLTFSSFPGVDTAVFVEPKVVSYPSIEGVEIEALLYLPNRLSDSTPIPFIVYAHGGPESQIKPSFSKMFQHYVAEGFGVLAVNPRGSSGYGRTFLMMDNHANRKKSLADYKAGVDWLIEHNYTKPGMIGIRGRSYGGYVVLGMITEYPDLFAAAVCEVGIANFETFLKNTASYRRSNREAEYGLLSDSILLREISPITKVDLIKTPLMLFHGINDPRVPIGEARQIAAAIALRGGVVDSLFFTGEGHNNAMVDNLILENKTAAAFFRKQLGLGELEIRPAPSEQ